MIPKLSLTCVSVEPQGQVIFKNKVHNDKIIIRRPKAAMYNLIMGDRYFHHFGRLSAENTTTKDTAEIILKEKPFFGKPDTSCEGSIKNSRGEIKYRIEGNWKTHIEFHDASTGRKVFEMQRGEDLPRYKENYGMPLISRNMLLLSKKNLESVCPTDARFRADMRAAENGDYDLASTEKEILEERQRERIAQREEEGVEWQPRWFEKVEDGDVGAEIWTYKGGYFEARKKGEWTGIDKIY